MSSSITFSEEFDTLHFWDGTTGLDTRLATGLHPWGDQGFSYGTDTWYVQPGTRAFVDSGAFRATDGVLTLTARQAATPYYYADGNGGAHHYTSGMVTTAHEFSQTYGYFEMRAEISHVAGTLPAFWLMPTTPPADGSFASELDVMEILGSDPMKLYTTAHSAVAGANQTDAHHFQTTDGTTIADASLGFHTYGVDWEADKITWYFDGQQVFQADTPPDMHGPHYLIANLDGPAGWQGQPDSSQPYDPTLKIDYIRAYSSLPSGVGTAPTDNASAFGHVVHDASGPGGAVYALHDALLDRAPDALDLEAHAKLVEDGSSVQDLAAFIIASPEGTTRYAGLGEAEFVEALYRTALNRDGEAAGLTYWEDQLAHGHTRADVATSFASSPEHLGILKNDFDTGVFVPDQNAADVARLYHGMLGHAPDASGLQGWTSLAASGTAVTEIAADFLASDEGKFKLAGSSDSAFVESLYENALGRHAEAGGLAHFTDALAQGAARATVAFDIAESPEAHSHLASMIESGWALL